MCYFSLPGFSEFDDECEDWKGSIARLGIVHFDIGGKIHFIHETFAEFFVAHFIINNLSLENKEMVTELLQKILIEPKYQTIRLFLDKAFEIQDNREKVKMSRVESLKARLQENKCLSILHKSVEEQLENLVKFIFSLWDDIRDVDFKRQIVTFKTNEDPNIFTLAYDTSQNLRMLEIVWQNSKVVLNKVELTKLITERNDDGYNVLHMIANNADEKAHKKLASILLEAFTKEEMKFCLNVEDGERNVLCSMAAKSNLEYFNGFWMYFKNVLDPRDLEILFVEADSERLNVLHIASSFSDKNFIETLFSIIKDVLNKEAQGVFIQKSDIGGSNILHLAVKNHKNEKIYSTLWKCFKEASMKDLSKLLLHKNDSNGLNVLHLLVDKGEKNTMTEFLSVIQEVFNNEDLKCYLSVRDGKFARNILCLMAASKIFNDSLWKLVLNVFNPLELKNLLYVTDKEGFNVLQIASRFGDETFIQALLKLIFKVLSEEKQTIYIRKLVNGSNVLHLATQNDDNCRMILSFWKSLKDTSMKQVLKSMLQERNSNGQNVLHLIVVENNVEVLENFITVLNEVHTEIELKCYLNTKETKHGRNVMCLMTGFSKQFFDSFWAFLLSVFDLGELNTLLLEKDNEGSNFLQSAPGYIKYKVEYYLYGTIDHIGY